MDQSNAANKITAEQEARLKAMRGAVVFTTHKFAFAKKSSQGNVSKKKLSAEKKRERVLLFIFLALGVLYLLFFTNLIIQPEDPVSQLPPEKQALYDSLIKQAGGGGKSSPTTPAQTPPTP